MVIALKICGGVLLGKSKLPVMLMVSASLLPLAELMALTNVALLLALNVAARTGATDSRTRTSAMRINLNAKR